jgi:general secretion pathway protein K
MKPARRGDSKGAALLLVLWLVTLLTALVGAFALTARTEHLEGQVLVRGLEARQAARAGLEYAVARVINGDGRVRWTADGSEHHWTFGEAQVVIRIVDERDQVDLNTAGIDAIAALLRACGSDAGSAMQVAGAILDWRDVDALTQPAGGAEAPAYAAAARPYGPANRPFGSVAEVERVLGMTPALHARLAPLATVYGGNVGTYSIESRANIRGRTAALRVVLRGVGNGLPGSAWTPLQWEGGASPR